MKKILLMTFCCFTLLAFKGNDHSNTQVEAPKNVVSDNISTSELRAEIEGLISDRACDMDEQCFVIGLGSRECGGFDQFEVYSSKNIDRDYLLKRAQHYFELTAKENQESGMTSICSIEIEPKTKCLAGQCVIDVMASLPEVQ